MIQRDTIEVDGSEMATISAAPGGAGPYPVYIECCHAPGLDGFTERVLERCAENGFAAFAHNVFHRQGPDAKGRDAIAHLSDEELLRDTAALIEKLDGLAGCDTSRMAVGGHCMGGRVTLLVASSFDRFKAAADFWGGNAMKAWGREAPAVIDMVGGIKCPVIGFFGNDDGNPTPADVDRLDAELTSHGVSHSFHRYDGAGHAFQNFLNEANYRESQAEDAWTKVIAFFNENMA